MEQRQSVPHDVMLRYGSGQLGAQIFRDTPAVLLPIFMTTMLGVPAWMAGLAVLAPKVWVLICDPLIGAWSDRTAARVGRRPFLLVGALGTSIGFLSLFLFTHFPSPLLAGATICGLYLLSSTAFSSFSVPYLALASEMSDDAHERTRVLAYRMGFTVGGVILGVGVAQPLVFHFGGGALGWRVMAMVFAAICLVSMLSSATGASSAARAGGQTDSQRPHLLAQLSSVMGNQPYLIILATNFIQSISQACSYTVIGFFYIYVMNHVTLILPFVLVMSTGSLLAQPLWLAVSRAVGKERAFIYACLIFVAITVTWAFARPGTDVLFSIPLAGALSTQDVLVLVRAFAIGLTNAGFVLLTQSMLTDTINLQRRLTGTANEGVFSGLFSAVEKLAFALGPVIGGVVLSLSGFLSSTHGVTGQSASAIHGIQMLYSLIPATILMFSLLVFSFYGRWTNRALGGVPMSPDTVAIIP